MTVPARKWPRRRDWLRGDVPLEQILGPPATDPLAWGDPDCRETLEELAAELRARGLRPDEVDETARREVAAALGHTPGALRWLCQVLMRARRTAPF